jgi:hypothetical protein
MAIPFFSFYPLERIPMNKTTIVTDQMKYDYSVRIAFNLYMEKLLTESEYKEILSRLKQQYNTTFITSESNEIVGN